FLKTSFGKVAIKNSPFWFWSYLDSCQKREFYFPKAQIILHYQFGLTGGLCFTGVLIIIAAYFTNWNGITISTIIIPMAMGGQNAATSLTPINRTTHLTGPATDIGINIAKGNWNTVKFWLLRWIGFPLGSIIGFNLVHMVNRNVINISTTLVYPALIIIFTGIIQRVILNIPLLSELQKSKVR
ncbi:DUF1275 family protein, partial [Clostridium sp. Cult2]|uniref:DUF1275 family protein n=1 Tax=Clostridium sp. Cult2 TaxID=2079003 RepID=UPI001F26C27A